MTVLNDLARLARRISALESKIGTRSLLTAVSPTDAGLRVVADSNNTGLPGRAVVILGGGDGVHSLISHNTQTGVLDIEAPRVRFPESHGDGGFAFERWKGDTSYAALLTSGMSGDEYCLLSDGLHTFISAGAGGAAYIRAGANDETHQLYVSGATAGASGKFTVGGDVQIGGLNNNNAAGIEFPNPHQRVYDQNINPAVDSWQTLTLASTLGDVSLSGARGVHVNMAVVCTSNCNVQARRLGDGTPTASVLNATTGEVNSGSFVVGINSSRQFQWRINGTGGQISRAVIDVQAIYF